jgi:hypothetical protein
MCAVDSVGSQCLIVVLTWKHELQGVMSTFWLSSMLNISAILSLLCFVTS